MLPLRRRRGRCCTRGSGGPWRSRVRAEHPPHRSLSLGDEADQNSDSRAVTVTDLVPRHWFIPLSLPLTLEAFWACVPALSLSPSCFRSRADAPTRPRPSAVLHLSLALGFFNALPLPHLDGAHLLRAALCALGSAGAGSELPRVVTGPSRRGEAECGVLQWVVRRAAELRGVRWAVERRERVERGVRRWAVGVGGVTLVASGLVELVSWRAMR